MNLEDPVFGIDVSSHQGVIDWDAVKAGGRVGFVIRKATEGRDHLNKRFARDIVECKRVGIPVGAYHFATPSLTHTSADAIEEAQWFLKVLASVPRLDLPPVLDIEKPHASVAQPQLLAAFIVTFCQVVEAGYGVRPIVYSGNWWLRAQGLLGASFPYPLWTSAYPAPNKGILSPEDPGILKAKAGKYTFQKTRAWPVAIWQYSSGGTIAGIKGRVDLNVTDSDTFDELTGAMTTGQIIGLSIVVVAVIGAVAWYIYSQMKD